SAPVTLGGGITTEKGGLSLAGSAWKYPFCSQKGYHRSCAAAWSYCGESSCIEGIERASAMVHQRKFCRAPRQEPATASAWRFAWIWPLRSSGDEGSPQGTPPRWSC